MSDRRAPGADALRRQEVPRGLKSSQEPSEKGSGDPDTGDKEPAALGAAEVPRAASQNLAPRRQPLSRP